MLAKIRFSATTALCALVATIALAAQSNTQKQRTYAPYLGNGDVNVRLRAWASARNTGSPRVDTVLNIPWKLFSVRGELNRVAVSATRTPQSFQGGYRMEIGGSLKRIGYPNRSMRVQHNVWSRALPSAATGVFTIVGIPITVQANASSTVRMDLNFLDYGSGSMGAAVTGYSESYASGWASVGVGIPEFQAGVQADLRLGHQKFDGYIGAWPHYLSTWALNYDLHPARLYIRLFVEVFWRFYHTIVTADWGSRSFHPFIQ